MLLLKSSDLSYYHNLKVLAQLCEFGTQLSEHITINDPSKTVTLMSTILAPLFVMLTIDRELWLTRNWLGKKTGFQ